MSELSTSLNLLTTEIINQNRGIQVERVVRRKINKVVAPKRKFPGRSISETVILGKIRPWESSGPGSVLDILVLSLSSPDVKNVR